MALMIPPFGNAFDGSGPEPPDWTLTVAHAHLSNAHDFLAKHGQSTLQRTSTFDARYWGTRIKREPVRCPGNERLLPGGGEVNHSLAEVVNMTATVERLLDTLDWAMSSEFSEWRVKACHPTQSSAPDQNDLVLVENGDGCGRLARFEASDVSGDSDGNQKELHDLVRLNVLKRRKENAPLIECLEISQWPPDRSFLAVCCDFAVRLKRLTRVWVVGGPPHCRYERRGAKGDTVILEVVNGHV